MANEDKPWLNDPIVQPLNPHEGKSRPTTTADDHSVLGSVANVAGGVVDAVGRGLSFGLDQPLDRAVSYLFPNSGFAQVQQQREQQRQQFQQEHPVLNAAGEIAGSVPTYAIGEGALRAVVPLATRGGVVGGAANLAGSAVRNAAVSGAQTAGMEGDPVTGAVTGAVVGPVADLAGQGVKAGWRAISGAGGGLNAADAQLGQTARQNYKIPITAADMSENQLYRTGADQLGKLPFSGAAKAAAAKQGAWQGAIAQEMGEQATNFRPDVLQRAATRIGKVFDDVAQRTSIPPAETTQLVQDLDGVLHNARRVLQAGEVTPLETQVNDIKALINQNNGTLSGEIYQRLTNAKSVLSRLERQTSNTGDFAGDVRDFIDDAFARSASQADQEALRQARYQYRVMRTVDQLAAGSRDGNISPDAFMQKVTTASRKFDSPLGGMAYTGGGNMGELARIGKLMRAAPQTGSADRALVNFATAGAAGGTALAANPWAMATVPAALAANRGGLAYLRSGGLANRLIEGTLNPTPAGTSAGSPLVLPAVNDFYMRAMQQR